MEVPVPPEVIDNNPDTCDPKATDELYSCPEAVDWTTPPAFREVMVVEPLEDILNSEIPLFWKSTKLPLNMLGALAAK